jgi:orotidine-5'-phosphate decarboxylase
MSKAPAILENPICVALDLADADQILRIARDVGPHVGVYKIGLTAFIANGPGLVKDLGSDHPVFVDLKLHDIPAQVEGAVRAVSHVGATYTTVHAAGGTDMIRAAVDAAGDTIVLAVTVLTSLDRDALARIGFQGSVEEVVVRLAAEALDAGAPGLVCSPLELEILRTRFGPSSEGGPLLVVPGIRATPGTGDDQRRTLSAFEAVSAGADMIVVGRPITAAGDPAGAAAALYQDLHR